MKGILLVFILGAVYILYPFRELYVQEDPFNDTMTIVGSGYWTESACVEAAQAQRAVRYHCVSRSLLSRMMGTANDFNRPSADGADY